MTTRLPLRFATFWTSLCLLTSACMVAPAFSQEKVQPTPVTPDMVQTGNDIPSKWKRSDTAYDYSRREVMIPMRDGVKLFTVLYIPKDAHGLPLLLERTPYNAGMFSKTTSPHMRDAVWTANREWVDVGYILVAQDVRGKYDSEGAHVMTRPPIGPLNPSKTDDTTDAWDTIDWLSKNVPESNGRIGMIGSSYDGWTVHVRARSPHHGSGTVDAVSFIRSQSTKLCAEYLLRQAY